MTLWREEMDRREMEHDKRMEGLDILLDVVGNFTLNLAMKEAKGERGFDPFEVVGEVERGVEEAQIGGKACN